MKIQKMFTQFVNVWTCFLLDTNGNQIGDIILCSTKEQADKLKVSDFFIEEEVFEFPDLDFGII
jgi:hypothetical protein